MEAGIAPAGLFGTAELFSLSPAEAELMTAMSSGNVGIVWLLVAEVFGADPEEFFF